MRNSKGQFEATYSPEDLEMFKNWIKSGTTQEAFVKEVQKLFDVSMWTAIKWYTLTNKAIREENHA